MSKAARKAPSAMEAMMEVKQQLREATDSGTRLDRLVRGAKVTDWGRFTPMAAVEDTSLNIIAASQGSAGTGKSHFWLTAPEPIAYFLFDPGGLAGLKTNPLFRGRDVRLIDYCADLNIGKLSEEDRVQRSLEIMQQFQEDWDVAVANARTIVWDKEAHVWEMLRYAHNEVNSPDPRNFHSLNLLYRGWIQEAQARGLNFGLIRGVHDTWGKTGVSVSTGKTQMGFTGAMKAEGQKYVPELVQVNLNHTWDDENREFVVTIMDKCRLGDAVKLLGQSFPMLDFPTLGTLLYPGTTDEDWE